MLKKSISFVLAFVLVVVLCTPGLASNGTKQINATYGISLYFNEEKQNLVDGAGNSVAPFVYNGTTYVPIRAVSDLFGADVIYDQESNSAYIYDDYAELYAVANRMNNVITDCYLLIQSELTDALTQELKDYKGYYLECVDQIDRIYIILSTLGEDNKAVSAIVDDIVPSFTEFTTSFAKSHQGYENLRKYQTSYYANQFADLVDIIIDQYYTTRYDINNFYEQYCWRDIDQLFDDIGNGVADSTQQSASQTPPQNTNTIVSQETNNTQVYDRAVYVSNSGNIVHSIRNCSGMKYYRVMPISQARASGYQFCKNCW